MKIQVVRTQFGTDATNGLVFIDGQFECYSLEDQYQAVKVMHETCIPEGEYKVKLRTVGGFNERYTKNIRHFTEVCFGSRTFLVLSIYLYIKAIQMSTRLAALLSEILNKI
ncbi:hypothetical protein [uncultured phage MedDCM-OCT-S08-C495]|nr:hypothetical protein [uncultured phage MedDCM-OCT-S08-C495]